MTTGMSPAGALIMGHGYQHLLAWRHVLRMIHEKGIAKIGIEDPKAGNADDVTVYMKDGRRECYQAKYSVDAEKPAELRWLMEITNRKSSIIQGFHELWKDGHAVKPTIILVTNRLPPPKDPLRLIDGDTLTIARRLRHAEPRSKNGRACRDLAEHLGITREEAVLFLGDVKFVLGLSPTDLRNHVKESMHILGLCSDGDAVALGVGIVKGWVTDGKREIIEDDVRLAIEPLKRTDDPPDASILVQMIDRDPLPKDDAVALDWVGSFPGSEPGVRRLPSDPAMWNGRFRPAFQQAKLELRSKGHARILVRGHMRLPTWFAIGTELRQTAGFQVSSFNGQAVWSSAGDPSNVAVESRATSLGLGRDLAVGISLASDLSGDVLSYIRDRRIAAGKYVCIRPVGGANRNSVRDAGEARGWALGASDSIRRFRKSDRIHLFLSCPHGVALLLGHLWNRMPSTQLYEDLGPGKGYSPSYLIPA